MKANFPALTGFLSQEEVDLFYKQGYLIKRQQLDQMQIAELDRLTLDMISAIQKEILLNTYPCASNPQITYLKKSQIVFRKTASDDASILRVVGCGGLAPQVLTALRSKEMIKTFFDLIGCKDLEHIICSFHPKQPKDGVNFLKHRDIQYRKQFDPDWEDVTGKGSYAIGIIAIDAMSAINGGLYIDRNSYSLNANNLIEDILELTMEPGDLLFMHPEILHWSDANISNVSRRALLTGFCAWGANHKTYPGAEVNVRMTLVDREIQMCPVTWNELDKQKTINH